MKSEKIINESIPLVKPQKTRTELFKIVFIKATFDTIVLTYQKLVLISRLHHVITELKTKPNFT